MRQLVVHMKGMASTKASCSRRTDAEAKDLLANNSTPYQTWIVYRLTVHAFTSSHSRVQTYPFMNSLTFTGAGLWQNYSPLIDVVC